MKVEEFQELIWSEGRRLYRRMPWRDNPSPYYVLVSELMLQQTQVNRVIIKFEQFIQRFPDIQSLARGPLEDVLIVWNGLGYNRRALFLHEAAKKIVSDFDGQVPSTWAALTELPGVGPNTAGAILAYGFNQPVAFVETNIRSVYFYHFFPGRNDVSDLELRVAVEETLDHEHPREWYWALMDYGAYLKTQGWAQLDKSIHYKKQSPLEGSVRQIRGLIVKALTGKDLTSAQLQAMMPHDMRFTVALAGLEKDRLIKKTAGRFHLTRL